MKKNFITYCFAMTLFISCSKKIEESNVPLLKIQDNTWHLAQKINAFGSFADTITPGQNSPVTLTLNSNNTYYTTLSSQPVASGIYSINAGTNNNNQYTLTLHNYTTTGVFNLMYLYEVNNNNQVTDTSYFLLMRTSNDTLYLQSPPTAGGYLAYTFIKK